MSYKTSQGIPKNKRQYAAMLARVRADAMQFASVYIRQWIGPEPNRTEIADRFESFVRNLHDEATYVETVQGADVREQIDNVIRRMQPK